MIAALIEERCTQCNACVEACPTRVFEPGETTPRIAAPDACQTCYLCELACLEDALWVNPAQDEATAPPLPVLLASGQLGQVRRDSGWDARAGEGIPSQSGQLDAYHLLGPLLHEGVVIAERHYAALTGQ